jgi:hypothetical protein
MGRRLLVALLIGWTSGFLCYRYHSRDTSANDFSWAILLVHDLQRGVNPYSYPTSWLSRNFRAQAPQPGWQLLRCGFLKQRKKSADEPGESIARELRESQRSV